MNAKTVLKRMASFVLAGAAALSMTVFVGADGAAATATTTPTAANMYGKQITMDGKRDASEGWTTEPTITVQDQTSLDPLYAWIGTDGNYLYCYLQGTKSQVGFLDLEIDFLNTDNGKSETDYRAAVDVYNTDKNSKYAATFAMRYSSTSQNYGPYPYFGVDSVANSSHKESVGDDDTTHYAEVCIPLTAQVKEGLKNGTYTIGVAVAALNSSWGAGQHDNSFSKGGWNDYQLIGCRDVVLPQIEKISVAANLQGKNITLDNKRDTAEGWAVQPTFIVNDQFTTTPLYAWIGTDGDYLYCYLQGTKSQVGFLDLEIDFLNTDNGMSETEYRSVINAQNDKAAYSASYACRYYGNNSYYGPYPFFGRDKVEGKVNKLCGEQDDNYCAEVKIALPEYVKNALKTGSYTIGADLGSMNSSWEVNQYNTDFYDASNKSYNLTGLRDVILPSSNVEVIGMQTGKQDGKGAVRFVSALYQDVDYTKYDTVGFDVTLNGKTVSQACAVVYDSISANYGATEVTATSQGAKYLFALTVTDLAVNTDYTFTVQPWAKQENGETVKGVAYTVTVRVVDAQNAEQASLSVIASDPVALNLANELAAAQGWTVGEKKQRSDLA